MRILKLLLKIGGWILIATAVLNLTISFFFYRHTQNFIRHASTASATITKLVERPSHDSGTVFYPVYTFQDSNGQTHEIYSSSGSFPPAYHVGQTVPVFYLPGEPDKAKLNSFLDLWILALAFSGFGAFSLVAGISMLVVNCFIPKSKPQLPGA